MIVVYPQIIHHHPTVFRIINFKQTKHARMITPATTTTTKSMMASNTNSRRKQVPLDILIVGGGLSGVMVAHEIQKRMTSSSTLSWKLLEARDVLGGRLMNDNKNNRIDLGGAWVWPSHQPHMKRLLKSLKLPTFTQPDDDSSTRIDGGAVEIVNALVKDLPKESIITNTPVHKCSLVVPDGSDLDNNNNKILVEVNTTKDEESFLCRRVVFAVPPKLLHKHVQFHPPLSQAKQQAMKTSHTWMAGVTKITLVYPNRFWDSSMSNMGLPRSYSQPAFQVYDASTKDGSVAALTFFSLVLPPSSSSHHNNANEDDNVLAKQVANQLTTIYEKYFGRSDLASKLQTYTDIHVQRWPKEAYISEDDTPTTIHPHPNPVRALSTDEWDGKLLFASSETDLQSPGVMEGAAGAALRVINSIERQSLFLSNNNNKS